VRMRDPQSLSTWSDYYLQGVTPELDLKYIIQIKVNGFFSTSIFSKHLFFFHDRLWNTHWKEWVVFPRVEGSNFDFSGVIRRYQSYSLTDGMKKRGVTDLFPFIFGIFAGEKKYQIIVQGASLTGFYIGTQSAVGFESEEMVQRDGVKVDILPDMEIYTYCPYIVPVEYYAQNGEELRKTYSTDMLLECKLWYNVDRNEGEALEYSPWEKVKMALEHVVKKYGIPEKDALSYMTRDRNMSMQPEHVFIMAKLFQEGWNADDLD